MVDTVLFRHSSHKYPRFCIWLIQFVDAGNFACKAQCAFICLISSWSMHQILILSENIKFMHIYRISASHSNSGETGYMPLNLLYVLLYWRWLVHVTVLGHLLQFDRYLECRCFHVPLTDQGEIFSQMWTFCFLFLVKFQFDHYMLSSLQVKNDKSVNLAWSASIPSRLYVLSV